MAERRRTSAGDYKQDPNAWMLTFSDLVMLLLTFFVLLLTMSSMDQKKLREVFRHLQEAVGVLEFSGLGEVTPPPDFVSKVRDTDTMIVMDSRLLDNLLLPSSEAENKIKEAIKEVNTVADVKDDERGIVFSFQESVLFNPGEVEIRPEALPFLDRLAETIGLSSNPIVVTGHSDNSPLRNNMYESNWELSLYRGLSVLDYFLNQKNLPAHRFMVGAAGPSRPASLDDSPESRALNRRVEIIFRHTEGL
jgi:chemotaxis protein MotB